MNSMNSETAFHTFKRLWRRAPIWRLCGMSAALLSLIGVLSFRNAPVKPAIQAVNQASYVTQTGGGLSADKSQTSASLPASAMSASSSTSKPVSSTSVPTKVQATNLSLATPGNGPHTAGELNSALGGRTFSGSVRVDGYSVPLPAGDWIILANAHYKSPHATGAIVFLGQVRNKRLVGGARVTALRTLNPPADGFPPKLNGCYGVNHVDLYVAPEAMDTNGHQSCWLVDSFFTPPMQQWADRAIKIDPVTRAAAGDLAAKGVTYPQDFLRVRMTRTETWGFLEVAYLFSPEVSGIKSNEAISAADTDWDHATISRYPEKLAYVEKMKQWATQFWPTFKSAFDTGSPR